MQSLIHLFFSYSLKDSLDQVLHSVIPILLHLLFIYFAINLLIHSFIQPLPIQGPETSYGPSNFIPSWMYWQKLPRSLQYPKTVILHRKLNLTSSIFLVVELLINGTDFQTLMKIASSVLGFMNMYDKTYLIC